MKVQKAGQIKREHMFVSRQSLCSNRSINFSFVNITTHTKTPSHLDAMYGTRKHKVDIWLPNYAHNFRCTMSVVTENYASSNLCKDSTKLQLHNIMWHVTKMVTTYKHPRYEAVSVLVDECSGILVLWFDFVEQSRKGFENADFWPVWHLTAVSHSPWALYALTLRAYNKHLRRNPFLLKIIPWFERLELSKKLHFMSILFL
jgi:hypothetical protein